MAPTVTNSLPKESPHSPSLTLPPLIFSPSPILSIPSLQQSIPAPILEMNLAEHVPQINVKGLFANPNRVLPFPLRDHHQGRNPDPNMNGFEYTRRLVGGLKPTWRSIYGLTSAIMNGNYGTETSSPATLFTSHPSSFYSLANTDPLGVPPALGHPLGQHDIAFPRPCVRFELHAGIQKQGTQVVLKNAAIIRHDLEVISVHKIAYPPPSNTDHEAQVTGLLWALETSLSHFQKLIHSGRSPEVQILTDSLHVMNCWSFLASTGRPAQSLGFNPNAYPEGLLQSILRAANMLVIGGKRAVSVRHISKEDNWQAIVVWKMPSDQEVFPFPQQLK